MRVCVVLTLQLGVAVSFRAPHVPSRRFFLGLKSSSVDEASKSSKVDDASKTAAISALERLQKQQQAELHETEDLLELLRSLSNGQQDPSWQQGGAALSTAASLLSGFDYGFVSRSEGAPSQLNGGLPVGGLSYGGPPANILLLGIKHFERNLDAIKGEYKDEEDVELTPKQLEFQDKLQELTLNSTEIWERELADGPIRAPLIIKLPYLLVCYLLDVVFEGRYVPSRFFLLETVARMPYFSYITMLHLYETLGFWRRSADVKRIHFAEEINEYRHLLIMESLGGDQKWWIRFVAQHSAIVYYVILCLLWALSPTLSYRFSELLEIHAVNTYGVFLDDNEKLLKELPPSLAAVEYYSLGQADPLYSEIQTTPGKEIRRPGVQMQSLYDVFTAIRADEGDHVSTMQACLDPQAGILSPSLEKNVLMGVALVATLSFFVSTGDISFVDNADLAGDVATEASTGSAALDALVAGAAGFAQKIIEDQEEGNLAGLGADLVEAGGVVEVVRSAIASVVQVVARFLVALL